MGQSPPSTTYNKDGKGLPFFQGIKDFGFRYPNPSVYCSAPRKIAEPGDVLFSVRAPIGELNIALERSCIGRGIAALRYNFGSNNFLFYLLKSTQRYWKRVYEGRGTVFGCVTKEHLKNFELVFPGRDVVERFNSIVWPLDEMIKKNEEESIILAKIRDTLLPRLLSGEIRVKVDMEEEFPRETKKLEEIRKKKARIRRTLPEFFKGA
jgi:type I restriction enzyme S subunit